MIYILQEYLTYFWVIYTNIKVNSGVVYVCVS